MLARAADDDVIAHRLRTHRIVFYIIRRKLVN